MAKLKYKHNTPVVEVLGPRILLSADLPGLDLVSLTPDEPLETDIEKALAEAESNLLSSPSDHSTEIQTTELVLVDTATDGYQQLVEDLLAQTDESRHLEVVLLDSERSGIDQISETLLAYQELDAVHLISHGSDGTINIGNTTLNAEVLDQNSIKIGAWSEAFSETGDLLIYGCNLAASEAGQTFVDTLAQLTDADVAASDDLTGQESLGGDWDLEYDTGTIEAGIAISQQTQADWQSVLANITVNNTLDTDNGDTSSIANLIASDGGDGISLREAIIAANNTANGGSPDEIHFEITDPLVGGAHTINLTTALDDITETVIIDGTTDSDFSTTPIIVLDGSSTTGANGLVLSGSGSDDSTIQGLVINNFDRGGAGIMISDSENNTIVGNYIGTDVT
ncbi:MAG: DUF4347 domain-containing protein, partial [Gammaproteobacteria bacterium]|nr:DUF4347 domain-containing protein [Gammaproteobacteria bacterium]